MKPCILSKISDKAFIYIRDSDSLKNGIMTYIFFSSHLLTHSNTIIFYLNFYPGMLLVVKADNNINNSIVICRFYSMLSDELGAVPTTL